MVVATAACLAGLPALGAEGLERGADRADDGDGEGVAALGLFAATREGLSFIRHHRLVLALTLGFWIVVLSSGADDLVLPFLATRDLHAGPRVVVIASAKLDSRASLSSSSSRKISSSQLRAE